MPEQVDDKTVFTLLEVSKSIQKTIADRYRSSYWVKAEMNKLNHYSHSGHCFPELVEKRDGKILAEMRSTLWKTDFRRINQRFMDVLGEPLNEGIRILFQAQIQFDPLYGMSLRILDIDPVYALGELEREKKESIAALQREGIFQANKKLMFPMVPKRIAIISVQTSKGLSDFYQIIDKNPFGYRIETTLYPAILQGDRSIDAIVGQLKVIESHKEKFDAVAIIRGGGGEVGLTSFNHYRLARAVALFPIPVLTGIGHSTNETVTEMVAHLNAITPTELAESLLQKFHAFSLQVELLESGLISAARALFLQENDKLQQYTSHIIWHAKSHMIQTRAQLDTQQVQLTREIRQFLKNEKSNLGHLERIIAISDPVHLLRRGFSIVRYKGKSVRQVQQVEVDEEVTIQLEDGLMYSKVTKKIKKDEK